MQILDWLAGNGAYHTLVHCMGRDFLWITITVTLDLLVAAGYVLIAVHWWKNQKQLDDGSPPKLALQRLRNIFIFCGICGYAFIPLKMMWPAWRLYDIFMVALVYSTWRYAWNAKDLKVVFSELGQTKQLKLDLAESQAEAKRKSFFLNAISHDLRTPLNGLVLQANLGEIQVKGGESANLAQTLSEIRASAEAAASMLNSFLELGKLDWSEQANTVTRFCADDLINGVIDTYKPEARRKSISIKADGVGDLWLNTDRFKMDRIVNNLVQNAVKFTEEGGVTIAAERHGNDVVLHVSDTGIGISAEDQKMLFEDFFQAHNQARDRAKGFGLGLAISKRLVGQLGGSIACESVPKRGTRFSVRFPGVVAGCAAKHPVPAEQSQKRLLLVEDDRASHVALKGILEHYGWQVDVATNLKDAMQRLEHAPGFIILDLMLPDGDGTAMLEAIRIRSLPTKVIVTTGVSDPDRLRIIEALKPTAVLKKPVNLAQLLQVLN